MRDLSLHCKISQAMLLHLTAVQANLKESIHIVLHQLHETACNLCFEIVTITLTASIVLAQKSVRLCRQQWEKVGEVVGGPAQSDTMDVPSKWHNGQQYDFVVDVDFEEGVTPKKLAFNRSDNPYNVAERWATLVCGLRFALGKHTAVCVCVQKQELRQDRLP